MSPPKRPRKSRIETTRRILVGARRALVVRGWQSWGINAIAAEAAVQKVLIYRYFDDLEGLCKALSAELVIFPLDPPGELDPQDLISGVIHHWAEDPFADYVARLCPILPPIHPFSGAFSSQRREFSQRLGQALQRTGQDPATTPAWIACLLDRSLSRNTQTMLLPTGGIAQTDQPSTKNPRNLFDPSPTPRYESHDLPVELL